MAVVAQKRSGREKRQQAKRLGILSDAQVAVGWFVILALVALVGAIYLSQASSIASTGRKVQLLQNSLNDLKRGNAELERDIAEAQSLERLQQEAARLGFVRAEPQDMEYLVVTEYPEEPAPEATPTAAPPTQAQTMGEALWLAVRGSVTGLVTGQSRR